MDDFEILQHKYQLTFYESIIKSQKNQIKYNKINIIIFSLNYTSFCFLSFHVSIFYFIYCSIWAILIFICIKNIKLLRKKLKINIELYYNELKIVDYSKYLKEQRKLKLQKIKKVNLC